MVHKKESSTWLRVALWTIRTCLGFSFSCKRFKIILDPFKSRITEWFTLSCLTYLARHFTDLAEVEFHPRNQTLGYTYQRVSISEHFPSCNSDVLSLQERWWALEMDKESHSYFSAWRTITELPPLSPGTNKSILWKIFMTQRWRERNFSGLHGESETTLCDRNNSGEK